MTGCIRCGLPGRVLVHQVDTGTVDAVRSPGRRTADILACLDHARAIAAEPGAPAWLAPELERLKEGRGLR